jgi:hydrogenase expression/formation protein HypE
MSSDVLPFSASCAVPIATSGGGADRVLLAHGSGGRLTAQLIERVIVPAFDNPVLARLDDAAVLELPPGARAAFTTDSYVVTPLFFPGGDIGALAVNGTINDLAMAGARPVALSLSLLIEEGLPLEELKRVIESARAAAARAGVPIVTGDTKVVGRGAIDRLFVNTSGVGAVAPGIDLGFHRVQPGDAILVSGCIGDHGVTILSRREGLQLDGDLQSDTAPLHELVAELLAACGGSLSALRDPTRGGLAATLVELATRRRLGVEVDEACVPVRDSVRGACELLGLDPLLVANEGKLVAFVAPDHAERALGALRAHSFGTDAALIGHVVAEHAGTVILETPVGGQRILDLPFTELLPRIC